ncbi:proteasome subunit beta type-1-B-like [Oscarella lobularis]|uniref:proteasome subunit beta type-1-B-like n=1 Tax=Oscarella lobularis TaxID=121494 RepID=UPI003313B169
MARFSPYVLNGGTIFGVSGDDFALIASDTRLSEGFRIHSRDVPKIYTLTDSTILGCCGFQGDCLTLNKHLASRLQTYKYAHHKDMSSSAVAQMLSTILYYKRFFPYYTYNVIAGLDSEGKGAIYSFDPVGSYEREVFRAGGTAANLLQPLLDNQIGFKNQVNIEREPLNAVKAIALIKDVFTAAAERDIYTGDGLVIKVVTKDGVETHTFPLRKD